MISDNIRSYVDVMNGEELARQLLSEVQRAAEIKTSDNDTHVKLEEIKNILQGFDRELGREIKDLTKAVEGISREVSRGPGVSGGSSAKPRKFDIINASSVMDKTYRAINNLNKTLTAGITINVANALGKSGGGRSGGAVIASGGGGGGGGRGKSIGFNLDSFGEAESRLTRISSTLIASNMIIDKMFGIFSRGLGILGVKFDVLKGVSDGITFTQDMRAFMYTTQGAGVALTNLEKPFIKLGDVAAETGRLWSEAATIIRKDLTKGLTTEIEAGKVRRRTVEDTIRLTKNSLRTATLIGANAESTAEMFSEWNRHLGMTNQQLTFVGREMEQVARNSGVTGDELLQATKAAAVLVKEVRSFAGVSAQAMSQIIQTQASLRKFGAEDIGARFNKAMTQGVRSLAQAEPVIASIIAESAQKAGVSVTGSMLTSGAQQRQMQKAIMDTLRGRLGSIGLGGVDPAKLLDRLEEMRDAGIDTGQIEQQIMNITGLGAGELQNYFKSLQEASMSFSDRIKMFDERISGSTTAEGRRLAEQQRSTFIEQDRRQQLSTFTDLLGNKGNLTEALKQFNQRMAREGRGDVQLTQQDLQKMASQSITDVIERSKKVGLDIEKELLEKGLTVEGLEKGLLDEKSANQFAAILQEVENKTLIREKAIQDPVTQANQALKEVNEKLTNAVQDLYTSIVSFEGVMGVAIGLLAAKAGLTALNFSGLTNIFGPRGLLRGIAGRGGSAALGAGATNAAGRGGSSLLGAGLGKLAGKGAVKAGIAGTGAALGASTFGISLLVTGALGGFIGAMESAAQATTIFNKKQEDLTYTNKAAAKSAGFLTGALDFITFGLFDKYIGPTGEWTVQLAKFFDDFWPLALLGDNLLKPFELLWSTLKGLWGFAKEVGIGIWDGIRPVWDSMQGIFDFLKTEVIKPIGAAFKDVFGVDTIDIMQSITSGLTDAGKAVGEFFRTMGPKLAKAIEIATPYVKSAIGFLKEIVVPVFQSLFKWLKGVWDVAAGLFTLDTDRLLSGLHTVTTEGWNLLGTLLSKAGSWLVDNIPIFLRKGWDWVTVNVPDYLSQAFSWIINNVPTLLNNAMKQVVDYVLSLLPNRKDIAEKVKEQVTGRGSKITKNLAVGSGLGLGGMAASTVAGLLGYELFDVGSNKITSDGLAYLHKGEMVVPPEEAEQLRTKATSERAFGASAMNLGLFDNKQGQEAMEGGLSSFLAQTIGMADTLIQGVTGLLGMQTQMNDDLLAAIVQNGITTNKLLDQQEALIVESQRIHLGANVSNMGLFASSQIKDAMAIQNVDTMQQMQTSMMGDEFSNVLTNRLGDAIERTTERVVSNPVDAGLFAASNARETFIEAMRVSMNGGAVGRLMEMFGLSTPRSSASVGNSLYYNKEDDFQNATTRNNSVGGTTVNYINQSRRARGLTSKGSINTNMIPSADVEDYILQSQILSQPSGSSGSGAAMPVLERIAEAVESGKLDEIIMILTAIRDKRSDIMVSAGRPASGGAPSIENSGLREGYNKGWLNGDWTHLADPAYSDNANILGTSRS